MWDLNAIVTALIRDRQEKSSETHRREGDVKAEAETGVMCKQQGNVGSH